MSKVLIVVCLAIVTPMVSWTAAQSSDPKAVTGTSFIGKFVKEEVQLSWNEYVSANATLIALSAEIDAQANLWYSNAVEQLAHIWINRAKRFLAKQAHNEPIPKRCMMIQQKLFDYGSLVAQRLLKCVVSHQLKGRYFIESLWASLHPYYSMLQAVANNADKCELQTDFGSIFGCQGKVLLEFMRTPSVKTAAHRHVFTAAIYAKTVQQQLQNCPYLANMVDYEIKATKAAMDAYMCTR